MPPSVDIVIPTHNRWDLTERCLGLLQEQCVPHTVIVADNGSSDGTPERIRRGFPQVRVVELERNLGFPKACNTGAAAGDGDIITLLNNDVEPSPEFLDRLLHPFAADDRVGTAAALLMRPGNQIIDSLGLTADPTLAGFPRLRGKPANAAKGPAPVLAGPSGAGGAYRRSAWEEVDGLDEGVLFYGEDVDLALRIRAAGWRAASAPDAVAVHVGSATFGTRSAWQRYQSGFARGYFVRRYRAMQTRFAARLLVTELGVIVGDAVLSHDLSALRGRIAGWRSADGETPRAWPPPDALDMSIGFIESLRLRREVYGT